MLPYFKLLDLRPESFAAYIFDCDGTLADSMPLHFQAWQYALRKNHATFDFTWKLFRALAGMSLVTTVEYFNEHYQQSLDVPTVLRDQAAYIKEHMQSITPIPEIVAFATWAAEHQWPRAVASGNHRGTVLQTLDIIKADHLFDTIITQDDVSHGKPAPDMYLLAAQQLQVPAEQCLVLEDSILGIEAATRAGMASILTRLD